MHILDELGNLEWSGIVAQRDCIGSQPGEFFDRRGQREEVVFDRDVEFVFVFEIDGDCTRIYTVSACVNFDSLSERWRRERECVCMREKEPATYHQVSARRLQL